ncbi:MAG: hypothetical protein GQ468_05265 [Candidatus Scalindua sp.]|nr:hypothetical protein [Candidatus Scalindua sp.]
MAEITSPPPKKTTPRKSKQPVLEPLDRLRLPFDESLINWLPKPSAQQNKCQNNEKISCKVCGGRHHPRVRHVSYLGHAAITSRLLDVDKNWKWEPLQVNDQGLPKFDPTNGLWINLTVCGITRLGYGDALNTYGNKSNGDMIKETIGDAIRNAAMRFGCGLEMWFKGDNLWLDLPEREEAFNAPPEEREIPSDNKPDVKEARKPKPDDNDDKPDDKAEKRKASSLKRTKRKKENKPDDDKTYPQDEFDKNYPDWKKAIETRRMTGEQVIKLVETKAPLTEEQKSTISQIQILELDDE